MQVYIAMVMDCMSYSPKIGGAKQVCFLSTFLHNIQGLFKRGFKEQDQKDQINLALFRAMYFNYYLSTVLS